jgi:hypothetical protein
VPQLPNAAAIAALDESTPIEGSTCQSPNSTEETSAPRHHEPPTSAGQHAPERDLLQQHRAERPTPLAPSVRPA